MHVCSVCVLSAQSPGLGPDTCRAQSGMSIKQGGCEEKGPQWRRGVEEEHWKLGVVKNDSVGFVTAASVPWELEM